MVFLLEKFRVRRQSLVRIYNERVPARIPARAAPNRHPGGEWRRG